MKKELTCIGCPMGCLLDVVIKEDGTYEITGNQCPKGEIYAKKEVTNPTRIITSSVPVVNGLMSMVSVKTDKDIPKSKLEECIKSLVGIRVTAPVHIGDIIVENVADTGVNIIATRNVEVKK